MFELKLNKIALFSLCLSVCVLLFMIIKGFLLDEPVKFYLLIFMFVGFCLAILRMFVNGMIKKLKGKHFGIKIFFFAVLLGIGLPFQNWFRTDVLLAMSRDYLIPCILVGISGMIFMTVSYGLMYEKVRLKYLKK